jgi:osmotically-inducible protein OsmY
MMRSVLLVAAIAAACANSGCVPLVAAGAVSGALLAEDRRTVGTYVDDQGIEIAINTAISERLGDQVHVNVTSYNRIVLLTGEAPGAELKAQVAKIAKDARGVRNVVDEVAVAGRSSLGARSNDALITSRVKANFIDGTGFQANHVKVTTEAGTVYLMGLVTREEGDAAAAVASRTTGVLRVVKVLEFVDPASLPAKPAPDKPGPVNAGGKPVTSY